MTKLQRDIYEFLVEKKQIQIFIAEDFQMGFSVKQIFDYLNMDSILFPDFRAEKFDDLRSYKDELFDIFVSLDKYYSSKKGNRPTLIFPKQTFKNRFPSRELRKTIFLEFADILDLAEFGRKLEILGYKNSGMVQNRGEFTFSNLVLDIFPINAETPVRIKITESNEIEEIREFYPNSQITKNEIENIEIPPAFFSISENRYLEILDDIEFDNFNVISPDFQGFAFWFLEDSELIDFQDKNQIFNSETIPSAKNLYNIELEKKVKKQSYQKSNILLDELSKDDYVVHSEYGIGLFDSLTKESVFGGIKDFLKIRYFGDNFLLLPIEKLNVLSRYISATGKTPKIDKLGRGGFQKKSQKVRLKLEIVARYIAEVSAKRKLLHSPQIQKVDLSKLQKSAGFEYTKDQKESIKIIQENMNQTTPMEHILIGDVGFGKTEVAINSIYATVQNGFQVAFAVPTTLLAKQHFSTIKTRLPNFRIAHIDRFVSAKQRKIYIQQIKAGEIDLIIGTQAILDFEFHNLAFLIIDEEHKFGVKQKTKLQEKYSNIHILSMSATPIPRTLHQAISKLKTISRLDTPPKKRLPVKTFLKEFDEVIIKNAVLKELKRNGQVFYIFNSILAIENKKVELLNILPHLKILILHSKISPAIMEKEIMNFANGEYDVLVSTTIIGTGIHIPNVNTIIIDGADRFGIADLHQLRGRVGRGENGGFCYFFVEKISELTENASKRLVALEENSELGSGSSLAMHDLEIRGGGNVVGENQSGHIDEVGYSLYVQILEEELAKLTLDGSVQQKSKSLDIQLSVEAYISENIISDERVKLEIYRRISSATNLDEVDNIQLEMKDRFGKLDIYTTQFLDLIRIRILGEKAQVKSIANIKRQIAIIFESGKRVNLESPTKDDDDILETILTSLQSIEN